MQPSSSIASAAVPTAPLEDIAPLAIRYAETDDDVIAMHRFLLVVAQPAMIVPVDPYDSLEEIIRVTKEEVALMAMRGDVLVGTLGLMRPRFWYNKKFPFLTDRWNFTVAAEHHSGAGQMLDAEAKAIAKAAGLPFINMGKIRPQKDGNSFLMFPRVSHPNQSNDCELRSV